jgi:hypothetical protein
MLRGIWNFVAVFRFCARCCKRCKTKPVRHRIKVESNAEKCINGRMGSKFGCLL